MAAKKPKASGLRKTLDVASENDMSLMDILKLYVFRDAVRDDDAHVYKGNPYENVLNSDAEHLFTNRDKLPQSVINFLDLQDELACRDVGRKSHILPVGMTKRYRIKGARLKDMKDDRERDQAIAEFLKEWENFVTQLCQSYLRTKEMTARYRDIRREMNATVSLLGLEDNLELSAKVKEYKTELRAIKKKILACREILTSDPPPSVTQVNNIHDALGSLSAKMNQVENRFKKRVQNAVVEQRAEAKVEAKAEEKPKHKPMNKSGTRRGTVTTTYSSSGSKKRGRSSSVSASTPTRTP